MSGAVRSSLRPKTGGGEVWSIIWWSHSRGAVIGLHGELLLVKTWTTSLSCHRRRCPRPPAAGQHSLSQHDASPTIFCSYPWPHLLGPVCCVPEPPVAGSVALSQPARVQLVRMCPWSLPLGSLVDGTFVHMWCSPLLAGQHFSAQHRRTTIGVNNNPSQTRDHVEHVKVDLASS